MKIKNGAYITVALLLLTGASVFEGSARVASDRELSETDYYVATNIFPDNTVVDVTNVENGRTVRAIVVSGLETTSLLAAVSRSTAIAIGLPEYSTGRIRIIEANDLAFPSDDFTFQAEAGSANVTNTVSAFVVEPEWEDDFYYEGDELPPAATPVYLAGSEGTGDEETDDEEIFIASMDSTPDTAYLETPDELADAAYSQPDELADAAYSQPDELADAAYSQPDEPSGVAYSQIPDEPPYNPPEAVEEQPLLSEQVDEDLQPVIAMPPEINPDERYVLVPDEERPPDPSLSPEIPPEYFIPPIEPAGTILPYDEAYTYTPSIPADKQPPYRFPLISSLESGKYYVQIGTSKGLEQIENEIISIGMTYPVAVQNIGNDDDPLFRILLGPLNSGESGAMLQRFKSIGYKDAFVRRN